MPTSHAKFSPSSFHRVPNCPGSNTYESLAPDSLPSKDSELGTFAHAVGDYSLTRRIKPRKLIGKKIKYELEVLGIVETRKQIVTQEIAFAVGKYYDFAVFNSKGNKLYIEQKIKLKKDLWGTLDCGFVIDDMLCVVDYKNGYGIVDVENNWQLVIYGLGLLKKLKNPKIKKVTLAIVQPRAEGKTVKMWALSRRELEKWLPKILEARKRALKNPLDLNAGPWCKWCKAIPFCPELYRMAKAAKFSRDIETVNLHQLKKLLDSRDVILNYLNEIDKHFLLLASHGKKIHGFKAVPKRATAYWLHDETEIYKRLSKKKKYRDVLDLIWTKKIKTPGQLRAIIGDKLVDKWSEKRSSGLKLVPESHPSKEANTLIEDFKD